MGTNTVSGNFTSKRRGSHQWRVEYQAADVAQLVYLDADEYAKYEDGSASFFDEDGEEVAFFRFIISIMWAHDYDEAGIIPPVNTPPFNPFPTTPPFNPFPTGKTY